MNKLSTNQFLLTPHETPQTILSNLKLFATNSQVNASVNINEILTDDLLVEILQRLPCISVFRAKAVCKRWYILLSELCFTQSFIRYHDEHCVFTPSTLPFTLVYEFIFWHRYLTDNLHSTLHTVSQHQILQSRGFCLEFLPCFKPWESHPIWVVASYKDLLVCCGSKMSFQSLYYICNPLTKQWIVLPPAPGYHRIADTAIGFIGMLKLASNFCYKLVRVPALDSGPINNQFEVEVFCSEDGEWTNLTVASVRSFRRTWQFKPDAIAFKNKLHWLVNAEIIVVFDPYKSTRRSCRVLDLPPELNSQMVVSLGLCQHHLKVCQITGGCLNREVVIWTLCDYVNGNWHSEFRICLKEMVFVDHLYFDQFKSSVMELLAFHPSDSAILFMRFNNQIVRCNVESRTLEVASECLDDPTFSLGTCGVFLLMHPCWPSLFHRARLSALVS